MTKVLIAAPIGGHKQYSINEWFQWIADQTHKDYDICICVNGEGQDAIVDKLRKVSIKDIHGQYKKIKVLQMPESKDMTFIQKVTFSREKIRRYARGEDYDYLFFLDTDTIPAYKNTIDHLISKEKDFISGLYFYKNSKVIVAIDQETSSNVTIEKCREAVKKKELLEIWGCGFGCVLLSKPVFENFEFNYDLFGEERTDDFGYCHIMEQNNITRWLDPLIICKHYSDNKSAAFFSKFKKKEEDDGQDKSRTETEDQREDNRAEQTFQDQ